MYVLTQCFWLHLGARKHMGITEQPNVLVTKRQGNQMS